MAADTIQFTLKNDAGTTLFSFNLPLFKLDATTAPVVGDDDADGYVAGSLWVDRTNDKIYVCTDNATGAAVWVQIAGTGAGGTNALLDGANHTDTVAQAVTRGSLIIGNATPAWDELNIGAANALLGSDGTDVAWFGCTAAGRAILDDADAAAQRTTLGLSANGSSLVTAADYAAMRGLLDLEAGTDFYSIAAADAAFQPKDATLTALAAYNTNGILTQTAADTFTGRTITGTANEITVTNGDGVTGNPTLSLPTDFQIPGALALEGVISATFSAAINVDFSPIGIGTASVVRLTSAGGGGIVTGITGGTSGRILILTNVSSAGPLQLAHEDASSTAANRIRTGSGSSITLEENGSAILQYDSTTSRWRVVAPEIGNDPTLTALAAYNTNGLITQTAANTFTGRTITGTANQITVADGNGVSGNPTLSLPADVVIPTVITVPNAGLHILDTNASHDMIIACGSDISADRTVTFTPGDSDRTVTLSGNLTVSSAATISGTNTGDQSAATQAEQETGSSTTAFVTPGRQQYHPSAAKGWAYFEMIGTWSTFSSYNVSSITDSGTGVGTVNWDIDSSGNYCVLFHLDLDVATATNFAHMVNITTTPGAGTITFRCNNGAGTATDAEFITCVAYGDQ